MNYTSEMEILPFMLKENTCCFTGHRKLPEEDIDAIVGKLDHAIKLLAYAGYEYFICGGALGFDMLAEERVLHAAKTNPKIKLVLALPCRNQTEKWGKEEGGIEFVRKYHSIRGLASATYYIEDFYTSDCMRRRNYSMVERSSFCVAYYNGNFRSGAGQTFRMAEKEGLKIYNIFDLVK